MKFSVEQKAFAAALAPAVKIVKKNSTIPILTHVLIEAADGQVAVTSDNLDIRITTPAAAEIEQPGSTTVPAHMLHDIVRRCAEGSTITVDDTNPLRVALKAGRARFALPWIAARDFPDGRTAQAFDHRFALPAKTLAETIARISYAICTEGSRYYLNGIYIHHHGDALRFVVTNGHCLALIEQDAPAGSEGLPGLILPRESCTEIARLATAGEVQVAASRNLVEFRFATGTVFVTKLIDGTFPDYGRVIPAGNDKLIVADREALTEAIVRIAAVAEGVAGRATSFAFTPDRLTVSVDNREMGEATEDLDVATDATLTIGFNAAYMRETLAALDCDEVEIALHQAGSPGLFRPKGKASPTCIIMPIRV